jgi:flagellar motor switch protein FliM
MTDEIEKNEAELPATDETLPLTTDTEGGDATVDSASEDSMSEEERMAAEMEAMMLGGEGAEMGGPLDQGTIDDLFGSDDEEEGAAAFSSLEEEIIARSMQNYERLPMLDVIFERFVLALSSSLKTHTSAIADVTISSFEYRAFSDAMLSVPMPSLLNVVDANPWNNSMIVALDAPVLNNALEIMLGGRASQPSKVDGRTFTTIERRMGASLCETMIDELSRCFSQLTDVEFSIGRTETNPQFASISQPEAPCVHIKIAITLENRKGIGHFIIPYSTLEPVRKILSKVFFGERIGGDKEWRDHLSTGIEQAHVALACTLTSFQETLSGVLGWSEGQTIELEVEQNSKVLITYNHVPLFTGATGQTNSGRAAVQIEENLYGIKDLQDELHVN